MKMYYVRLIFTIYYHIKLHILDLKTMTRATAYNARLYGYGETQTWIKNIVSRTCIDLRTDRQAGMRVAPAPQE